MSNGDAGYLDGVAYLDDLSYEAEDLELARLLSTRGWHVYGERNLVADELPMWRPWRKVLRSAVTSGSTIEPAA